MILDRIENKDLYINIHPLFKKAFDYLEEYLKNPVPKGTYEIQGEDLFVKVQNVKTRDEGFLEVHDKYIDLQVMIEGEEMCYCDWRANLKNEIESDADEDYVFFGDGQERITFTFSAGEFMILFPQDAHKPSMDKNGVQQRGKKLVFKIKI